MVTTLRAWCQKIAEELAAGALPEDDARLEAGILLAHVLGKPRSHIYAHPEAPLTESTLGKLEQLVQRRSRGEPVAYLVGNREFWSLPLAVTRDTLIPRPETELLVEVLLEKLGPEPKERSVLDMGTGSGAIAAALAHERSGWRITATDVSAATLAVARANFVRLGLANVATREGSWFAALPEGERFDAIVSNPPYVADDDPHLASANLRWEPRIALAAGPDGLSCLRQIAASATDHLIPGGILALEHGYEQGPSVRRLLTENRFRRVESLADLSGHERMTLGYAPDR